MDKHNVRKGKEITFADDVTRTIKPLSIKQLRKFVVIINKMDNLQAKDTSGMSEEDIDLMVDAAEVILSKVDPVLAEDREALEDAIDLQIFNEIMGIAMGNSSPEV